MSIFVRYALVTLFSGCFGGVAALAAEPDIAGLKLGMSPQQAKAALVAFGLDPARIQEKMSAFRFSDGVNTHSTSEFLDSIVADIQERRGGQRVTDNFRLVFSPPPKGGQLVMVRRQIVNPADPPTVGEYQAALLDKHGKPDEDKSGSMLWLDPHGAVNCTGYAPEDVRGIMSSIYMGSDQSGWRLNQVRNAKNVRNPSQCARMLQYTMLSSPNRPATRVRAILADVPGWGTAYLATLEWIEAQRQAAVKSREGTAAKPKL